MGRGIKMTDQQILNMARGIERIRECCQRAWIELNSNLVTVLKEDKPQIDLEFYVSNNRIHNIANRTK